MVSKSVQKRARSVYPHMVDIPTRWMDNDIYGHVNNVNYYSFFDTAVNGFLIRGDALDIHGGPVIGFVVETKCQYFAPVSFPQTIQAGIAVSSIGTSSVRYEIGLFPEGESDPVAEGYFVHVYVDRATRRPTSLSGKLRSLLETIQISE